MGVFVSKNQYNQACSVDLYEFLLKNHSYAVKVEYGSVLLLADKHVSVKKGFHGYRNFRTGETGNNVDYLTNFLGYGYQDAVLALIGSNMVVDIPKVSLQTDFKEIVAPEPTKGPYRNLYAFLSARKIPLDVIQRLIDSGILYQSEKGNNIVFINPQNDYCELRGTNAYADRRCRSRVECQRYQLGDYGWCQLMDTCVRYKPDPFHGCRKTRADRFWYFVSDDSKLSQKIYVCEAAIDAISLYVMHRAQEVKEVSVYVSIGGVANQKTIDRLVKSGKKVVLAVDNDAAGQSCRDRNPTLESIIPKNKDWNDDLRRGDY